MAAVYILLLFISGSLMFSHWLGLLLKKDITKLNDGNPGASNLWQSAGAGWGLLGILLDFMKGYLPLALLIWSGKITGWLLIPAGVAPILGHAFSPFLLLKGGKSKTVTFGVWSALTDFEVSIAYAVVLALMQILIKLFYKKGTNDNRIDAWTAVLGMLLIGPYLIIRGFSAYIIIIWIINTLIFIFVNRKMLMATLKELSKKEAKE